MKKMFRTLLMAGVLATGAVACASDDEEDDTPTEETASDDTAGSESQSEDVQEYCDAAQAFADEVEDDGITADLGSEGQALVARGAEASAGASSEDAERIGECTDLISEALTNI